MPSAAAITLWYRMARQSFPRICGLLLLPSCAGALHRLRPTLASWTTIFRSFPCHASVSPCYSGCRVPGALAPSRFVDQASPSRSGQENRDRRWVAASVRVELKTREAGLRTGSTTPRLFTTVFPLVIVTTADIRHGCSIFRTAQWIRFNAYASL